MRETLEEMLFHERRRDDEFRRTQGFILPPKHSKKKSPARHDPQPTEGMKMIELGSFITDRATGLEGMATHLQIEMNGSRWINFQPRGLNPKTGQPVEAMWITEDRVVGGAFVDEPNLPTHVLGTTVEDDASGFYGMAVSLVLHINGCVHFNVQPKGVQETGAPIATCNFDIRRLRGTAIKTMTKAEQTADEKMKPSPSPAAAYRPTSPR